MALVDTSARIRHEIPHEPGEWMEFKPLTIADARTEGANSFDVGLRLLARSIAGWSYADECDEDNIMRLDIATANWAIECMREISHISASEGEASAAV